MPGSGQQKLISLSLPLLVELWVALLESNDVVARLDVCDTLTNRLDDASTLVSQDNGESALGILSGERVRVCSPFRQRDKILHVSVSTDSFAPVWQTPV